MFRRLIMTIFRLYMKYLYLLSSYTKYTWAVYMVCVGGEGGKVGTRSRICWKGW